jgi:hypothetical protein
MALAHSPRIVTNNITLYYDEQNMKSGNSLELIKNRPAIIQSSSERRFSLDSDLNTMHSQIAQYNSSALGSGFSFSVWAKRTGITTGNWDPMILIDSGGPRYRMLWFGWFNNTTDRIHCSMPYYSAIDTSTWFSVDPYWSDAGLSLNINQWYNICATYSNSSRVLKVYINSILGSSGTRPGLGDLNNPNNSPIQIYGCNGNSVQNSQVNSCFFYNRELTQQEVQQNFNALRGRYGS